jgi:hypothetical protein
MKRSIYDENGNIIGEQIKNENEQKELRLKGDILDMIEPHLQIIYDELEKLKDMRAKK